MSQANTYCMELAQLLEGIAVVPPEQGRMISGLVLDSRQVNTGDLFIALPGLTSDGRQFVRDAIVHGAAAVVYEAHGAADFSMLGVPALAVSGLQKYIGPIADRFYGSPSKQMTVIGVTGTNGKTTCTHLLARALDRPNRRCGLIGTLGNGFPGALSSSLHTTPDAVSIHRWLAQFLSEGAAYVCMEVSSHALEQQRVAGVVFGVAVFTNLSRDHLDYHGDMATYGAVKAGLFAMPGVRYAVINLDDEFGAGLLHRLADRQTRVEDTLRLVSYGLAKGDVRTRQIKALPDGLLMEVETLQGGTQLHSPLLGRFNASNLLAALAALLSTDMPLKEAVARLADSHAVPGRMECFEGKPALPLVVVDYAHTPDALEKALEALREHARGRLWCVFGCGGDRDRGKRPLMGGAAERLADKVVLTDDNPRHEVPDQIIEDILGGMHTMPAVIRPRIEAIRFAIQQASPDDIVLVAGKGHEDYQQIGSERLPYSDRLTVQGLLEAAA